eukprot:gene4452-3248_t
MTSSGKGNTEKLCHHEEKRFVVKCVTVFVRTASLYAFVFLLFEYEYDDG